MLAYWCEVSVPHADLVNPIRSLCIFGIFFKGPFLELPVKMGVDDLNCVCCLPERRRLKPCKCYSLS